MNDKPLIRFTCIGRNRYECKQCGAEITGHETFTHSCGVNEE